MARKPQAEPSKAPATLILRLGPRKYAVAAWLRDEEGEPLYEIVHENVRDLRLAKTLAREAAKRTRPEPPLHSGN